ncbi:asparaginase [Quadrisphaera sp. DSM 44207]|uniref:asparaginase n=1 Tax=Quadrisphaera sp. DSM 44207 TaxID=1881057 RepID=UPI0008863344|nr:asparaginase [Quadrisphaera sp. DSM 44207]SDQ83871.1 asparaginase [Quadrisphaera sp. DSM 44207]
MRFPAPRVPDLRLAATAQPLAALVRGPLVESVHLGHLVVTGPGGEVLASRGDPSALLWPRSALKPLQAVALVQAGLDLSGDLDLLALAAASHSGEPAHLEGVRRLLARAGLDEAALRNTPDLPLDPDVAAAWRAQGRGPSSLAQNCSGKHAAMLAASAAADWDPASYLDLGHPVQRQVRATVAELTGERERATTVDGCGTPLLATSLTGLARAYGRIATAPAGTAPGQVAAAVRAHPHLLGGTGRDVTALVAGVPGLVAKDGAEGVCAAALDDGRAVALKVLDGSARARPVVLAAVLRRLGVAAPALDEVGDVRVLGHGRPVGALTAVLPPDLLA